MTLHACTIAHIIGHGWSSRPEPITVTIDPGGPDRLDVPFGPSVADVDQWRALITRALQSAGSTWPTGTVEVECHPDDIGRGTATLPAVLAFYGAMHGWVTDPYRPAIAAAGSVCPDTASLRQDPDTQALVDAATWATVTVGPDWRSVRQAVEWLDGSTPWPLNVPTELAAGHGAAALVVDDYDPTESDAAVAIADNMDAFTRTRPIGRPRTLGRWRQNSSSTGRPCVVLDEGLGTAVQILGGASREMRPGAVAHADGGILMICQPWRYPDEIIDGIHRAWTDGHLEVRRGSQSITYSTQFGVVLIGAPPLDPQARRRAVEIAARFGTQWTKAPVEPWSFPSLADAVAHADRAHTPDSLEVWT